MVPRNQPIKTAVGIVMHDFHGLKTDLPPRFRRCLFLTYSFRDNPFLSRNVTTETYSKTSLKTRQIQDCLVFEILGSKHSLI